MDDAAASRPDNPGGRFLLVAACLVIVIAGLRAAAPILIPIALALFLAILSLPLIVLLRRHRIPNILAILIALLVNIAVVGSLMLVLTRSVTQLVGAAPRYVSQFEAQAIGLVGQLRDWGVPVSAELITDFIDVQRVIDFATGAVLGVASMLTTVFLVLLIMIFILGEATIFPRKLRRIIGREDADLGRYSKIVGEIQQYLGIKTLVSLATGACVGGWVWFLGLDFPLLWGLIAFLFNYIPSVGSILAAIPAVLLALIQLGPGPALAVALGYLAVNVAFGNFVEPSLLGRRLGLSTLVVILSLVFWGWVWGPVGMFLSVPLTMMVKIMLENTEDFRWVAVLLAGARSDELVAPPERPLAGEA